MIRITIFYEHVQEMGPAAVPEEEIAKIAKTEEEAAGFPNETEFWWSIQNTELGGFAAPQLPVESSLSGADAIREAVLQNAYDRETQTMTLQCYLDVSRMQEALAASGEARFPLLVQMNVGEEERRSVSEC